MVFTVEAARQKLAERRLRAKRDAEVRETRTQILQILYKHTPRIADLKQRSEAIQQTTDELLDLILEIRCQEDAAAK